MSKRIKDYKWSFSPPGKENKEWLAHDVSPLGNQVILLSPRGYNDDSWKEFVLVNFESDGYSTNTIISPKSIKQIISCNFLPDGDIIVIGYEGSFFDFQNYNNPRNSFTDLLLSGEIKLTCSILDSSSLRPMNEIIFSHDSDATKGLLKIIEMNVDRYSPAIGYETLMGDSGYRIDISYRDKESIPDIFQMSIRSRWRYGELEIDSGMVRIFFNKDLTDIIIPKIGQFSHEYEWIGILEKESQIDPPKNYPDRNWRSTPYLIDFTRHPFQYAPSHLYALLHDSGRKIVVSTRRKQNGLPKIKININLNFGQVFHSPSKIFRQEFARDTPGFGSDDLSMAFTNDADRLTVLSYLQYGPGKSREWYLHSYDVKGRLNEIDRTRLRMEGKWKMQSERKIRIDKLTGAGLPSHISRLIAINKINDKDGIQLFRYLRSSGASDVNTNPKDTLEKIDQMAFSSKLSKENAKWLIENRNHIELIDAVIEGRFSIQRARSILIDLGFKEYPEAVTRIVEGAEPETVAMIFGINPENQPAPKITKTNSSSEKSDNLPTKEKEKKGFFRRRNRFS